MASAGAIEGEAEYYGWMVKRGGLRKNWARRWFELRGASLIYYKDAEGESGRDRKGTVNLSLCSAARKSGNADAREFELEIVADKRIYRFVAEDAEKLDLWVAALEKSITGAIILQFCSIFAQSLLTFAQRQSASAARARATTRTTTWRLT